VTYEPASASTIQFLIPLAAAHALLDETVFARGIAAGFDAADFGFEDDETADTRVECSVAMARFLLKELRRLATRSQYDVELSVALAEAAIIVQRAIGAGSPS
jgi:hypothetical protein